MKRPRTVLIVDDDFDVRETLADVLRDEGYQVAVAVDGVDALEYLRANEAPALILLDWMMPRMDGAQFRLEQQKDPKMASVPVVLLTADVRTSEKARSLNAEAYLKKPVKLEALLEAVALHCAA